MTPLYRQMTFNELNLLVHVALSLFCNTGICTPGAKHISCLPIGDLGSQMAEGKNNFLHISRHHRHKEFTLCDT